MYLSSARRTTTTGFDGNISRSLRDFISECRDATSTHETLNHESNVPERV